MSHTPGPWNYDKEFGEIKAASGVIARPAFRGTRVPAGEVMPNAALIAASPDLLEALKLLKEAVEFTPLGLRALHAITQAQDAIAKAEGEWKW